MANFLTRHVVRALIVPCLAKLAFWDIQFSFTYLTAGPLSLSLSWLGWLDTFDQARIDHTYDLCVLCSVLLPSVWTYDSTYVSIDHMLRVSKPQACLEFLYEVIETIYERVLLRLKEIKTTG